MNLEPALTPEAAALATRIKKLPKAKQVEQLHALLHQLDLFHVVDERGYYTFGSRTPRGFAAVMGLGL